MKFGTWGFLASLITNPSSTFRNSKCCMQYGGLKCKKQKVIPQMVFCGIHFYKVIRAADYESDFRFSILNMAVPRWRPKIGKIIEFCCEFLYKSFLRIFSFRNFVYDTQEMKFFMKYNAPSCLQRRKFANSTEFL